MFVVDSVRLLAFMAVAALADRFWPLWMTALHGFGIVGLVAKAMAPEIMPNVYRAALLSAYLVMILALRQHVRRLRTTGHDRFWSISWHPSTPRWQPAGPTG